MKIEASDRQIQNILAQGYFRIPRFQRPYSWEKEEIENFWDDVITDKTDNYFIGSMVVYQTKQPYFGVVDGQQRLTTITVALSVIRDLFLELGDENLAKGIHQYIEKANNDYVNEYILNSETSFPYLQNQIQAFKTDNIDIDCEIGAEEANLKNAYAILTKKAKTYISDFEEEKIPELKKLRDKFLSLKLVFIQLDNEDDAYLIFETLNTRGKDLKTSDLVKNLILQIIKSSNASIDTPKEAWNQMLKRFDDISQNSIVDSFLLHYWLSKHEHCTDKLLFSKIKDYIKKDIPKAQQLLKDLSDSAICYCKMLSPESTNWTNEQFEVKRSLEALNSFKVKQQSSFVLSLMIAYDQKKINLRQLKTTLKTIEHFHYVFNAITQQRSSGSISSMYSKYAIELSETSKSNEIQKILSTIATKLLDKMPSYDEFEVKFLELSYLSNRTKSKNVIKYSLSKLLGDSTHGLNINHSSLTIEHLIPESFIKGGADQERVGNIGNLILIDSKTNNQELSDKQPIEKIKILEEKNYPIELNFIRNTDDWDESKVIVRAKDISKYLYDKK